MVYILLVILLLLIGWRVGRDAGAIDRTPVAAFDAARYMGTWYEIARFDHRFERGLEQVRALYTLQPGGRISVENSGTESRTGIRKQAHGKAHTTHTPGRLRVSFFWFFYADYRVLALGDRYEWALVGSRSPRYLWILSRTPTLSEQTLTHIIQQAELRGYPTSRLIYTLQQTQ